VTFFLDLREGGASTTGNCLLESEDAAFGQYFEEGTNINGSINCPQWTATYLNGTSLLEAPKNRHPVEAYRLIIPPGHAWPRHGHSTALGPGARQSQEAVKAPQRIPPQRIISSWGRRGENFRCCTPHQQIVWYIKLRCSDPT
jgi:hypothetical protein